MHLKIMTPIGWLLDLGAVLEEKLSVCYHVYVNLHVSQTTF